jgi:ribosomal protein RSM22 (predicted rRNA methylase)
MRELAAQLEGVSRAELARRSAAITQAYRSGQGSHLAVRDRLDALAYAVARMPATRAAVAQALARLQEIAPDFAPASQLDLGCGCGAASLAARDVFALARLTLVDRNEAMLTLARELLDDGDEAVVGALSLDLRRLDDAPRADLVTVAYVLVELDEGDAAALALRAFDRAGDALVLVEPGTPTGFARLRAARAALIAAGAQIAAPCPHRFECPIAPPDWRHFSVRVQRSRDHLATKQADVPFEDEPFIYLAATRRPVESRAARVIGRPRRDRTGLRARLCAPDGAARDVFAPARDKAASRALRRLVEGDVWPL